MRISNTKSSLRRRWSLSAFQVASVVVLIMNLDISNAFYMGPNTVKAKIKSLTLPSPQSSLQRISSSISYSDVALEDEKELLKQRLPPVNKQEMSPLEIEFRELLEGILYTNIEIEAIANPRMRAIMEGISASYNEQDVYRAFEVLYEDYIPLRVAGRMVYRRLRYVMEESKQYQQQQLKAVVQTTKLRYSEVESCWSTFIRLGDSQRLAIDDLKAYIGRQTMKALNCDTVDKALVLLNPEDKDSLSFEEVMTALYLNCDQEILNASQQQSTTANILQILLDSNKISIAEQSDFSSKLDAKHQKYNERYDEMLQKFSEWKPYIPNGEGRRLDILRGCFTGSENKAVVDALRIIYVDYGALRLSGDWIFKVVSTLMGATLRRRESRQHHP